MKPSVPPIRIALLGYPGVQTLDLVGPLDAFEAANAVRPGAYEVATVTLDGEPFRSESRLRITPDCALDAALPIDTLIVPGGAGLRTPTLSAAVAAAVLRHAPGCRRVVSICTGLYGVAPTGLLDGRSVTTHWRYAADVARRFPALVVDCDKIFIQQGAFYTAAGVTAAIDVSLALIQEDYGPHLSLAVARDLVVYIKRSGGQRQFSVPLQFQVKAGDRFADLAAWIVTHLSEELTVEVLASRVSLSARQFTRRFTETFGQSPADLIQALRLDAARDHLLETKAPIESIAAAVGFRSDDVFRRAFDRRFGVTPTDYRHRFIPELP
jgi:transcriptional regulator GlxA family with amidase domain